MNLKRKQKGVISLVVTFAMLFSNVGMEAAAKTIEQDAQPAITVDTGAELVPGKTMEKSEAEMKKGAEKEIGEEAEEESGKEIGEEAEEESGKETGEEAEEESGKEIGEEAEEEPGKGTEEEAEEESAKGTGEEAEEESGKGTGEEAEEESGKGTGEEAEEESGKGTGEEETGEEAGEKTEEEIEEKTKEDGLPETPKDESLGNLENSQIKQPAGLIPDVHEHIWSVDWNFDGTYHWHECEAEDCFTADDSEKDGYAEHSYDEYGE